MKQMIKTTSILTLVIFTMVSAHAGLIAKWDFDGISGGYPAEDKYGKEGYSPATIAEGVGTSGLGRGAGARVVSPNQSMANAWGAVDFQARSLQGALDNHSFLYFSLMAEEGYTMSLKSLETSLYTSIRGPKNAQWQFYCESIYGDQWITIVDGNNLAIDEFGKMFVNGYAGCVLDLGAYGLDDITDITFRLYIWGDADDRGTFYFHGDGHASRPNTLTVYGTVSDDAIPEPAATLLALAGVALLFRRKRIS